MSLSALQASAYLHHLHLGSPEPDRLADFYAGAIDTPARTSAGGTVLLRGPARRLLVEPGKARALHQAGFAVRDAEGLDGLKRRAEARGLSPRPAESPFFRDGAFEVSDPDGNAVAFGLSADEAPFEGRCLRGPLQHLTLASQRIEAIEDFYGGALGFGVSDRVLAPDGRLMTTFLRGNHEHHNLACFRHDGRTGIDHHSYEAGEWDTIRDWCDHLARHDVQLMWGPGRHGPGNNLFIFVVDPDGNWIEVSAELEVVHDRPVKHWPHAERTLNLWGRGILRADG